MEKCSICGSDFKTVPAGISKKTGKPYSSFIACSKMGCNGKPTQNMYVPQNTAQNAPNSQNSTDLTYTAPKQRNYDKENFGKCKHAFLVEIIKDILSKDALMSTNWSDFEKNAEKWAKMSMRKLGEPEVKNYGNGDISDQTPF